MEVIALVKGDKGLYYSDGNKMYFPDRTWKDAKEGFAELIEVSNDKGSYAFIRGKMLETVEPTTDVISKYINIETSEVNKIKLGDSVGFTVKDDDAISVYIQTSDSAYLVHTDLNYSFRGRLSSTSFRKRLYTYDLVRNSEKFNINNLLEDYVKSISYTAGSKDDFIESCVRIYSNFLYCGEIRRISLYASLFYVVETKHDGNYVYIRTANGDVSHFKRIIAENVMKDYLLVYTMSADEIREFMLKHHICGTYGFSGNPDLCMKELSALGVSIKVYAYNGGTFKLSMLENEELKELVDNSFEKLQSETKRIGKQCTGRLVSELQGLNPRSWLIG